MQSDLVDGPVFALKEIAGHPPLLVFNYTSDPVRRDTTFKDLLPAAYTLLPRQDTAAQAVFGVKVLNT